MKKVLSILFALLIVLSGMGFSIATHFCGGEIAAIKVSVSKHLASCGMETNSSSSEHQTISAKGCCEDEISYFTVDNFKASYSQLQDISKTLLQTIFLPLDKTSFYGQYSINQSFTLPPGVSFTNSVFLPEICIFRI